MLLPVLFFSMGLLTIAYQKIHAKCNIRILKHLMCVNRSHCAALNAEVASQSDKRLKRKVALVCSYVGSNYYGLQYAKSISGDGKEIILPTIEFEIQQALIRGQLILDSNSVDLGKIMWSRSSRTDKGVHAARIVLSCKLELQPHWSLPTAWNQLLDACHKYLKNSISTCLSKLECLLVCSSTKGFVRERPATGGNTSTSCRSAYSLSQAGVEIDEEAALARLRTCLSKFEGNRSFHNFHRMSAKALKGSRRGPLVAADGDVGEKRVSSSPPSKEMPSDAEDDEESEEEDPVAAAQTMAVDYRRVSMYEAWQASSRPIVGRSRGTVYQCRAFVERRQGRPVVRVRIRGQAFLLQ